MSLPLSPAQCIECAKGKPQRRMCGGHWARFTAWVDRFNKRQEWDAADQEARTVMILAWQMWERERQPKARCESCGEHALSQGACSSCGAGTTERLPFRRRRRRAG